MRKSSKQFPLEGGLNRTAPQIKLAPGNVVLAKNYEIAVGGGYRRIEGNERFDGRTKPSSVTYTRLLFDAGGTTAIAVGDTITGLTSGATARVAAIQTTSGALVSTTAAGELGLVLVTGTFLDNETLRVGGVYRALANGTQIAAAIDDTYYKAFLRGAQAYYRSLIGAVPGEGDVRGVWVHKNKVYAARNNVGSTQVRINYSSGTGWTGNLGTIVEVNFSNGNGATIAEGNVITQGANTATILRIVLMSGSFAAGTAAGRFILTAAPAPGNFVFGASVVGAGTAGLAGAATTVNMAPNGRFETIEYNFYASAATKRIYAVDGKNKGFELDDTKLVPLNTGMASDLPTHLAAHKNYLFFSFANGSLQNSSVGTPYAWTPITGASEIGIGDDITNIYSIRGDVLGVTGADSVSLLYGTGGSWTLKKNAQQTGAVAYSVQELNGLTLFMDPRGVFSLQAVQEYGDFQVNPISEAVQPTVVAKAKTLVCSVISRKKKSIRYFFNDKTVLTLSTRQTANGPVIEWMESEYPVQFTCAAAGEINGDEVIFAGASDGYVYQLDIGTSFDGAVIPSTLVLPFYYYGSPLLKKWFRRVELQSDAQRAFTLLFQADFDYGSQATTEDGAVSMPSTGSYWATGNWAEFYWGGPFLGTPTTNIKGQGLNMSLIFYHNDDIDPAFTLQSVNVSFDLMSQQR